MKTFNTLAFLLIVIFVSSCNFTNKKQETIAPEVSNVVEDSIVFSFSFMGCNRVDRRDVQDSVPSTANKYVLQRTFNEVTALERKPEIFFFLGDLVLAETNTRRLNDQLKAWVALYEGDAISKSGIEMVASPGNHEMLYAKEVKKNDWKEFPLRGGTDVWLKYMKPYMPKDRDSVASSDTLDNRLTFSFIRQNVGFIVMNTDSYNPPSAKRPYGTEGMIPTQWVIDKVQEYQKNPAVEHIFVLGHKPYYVDGVGNTGHGGLPEGPTIWPAFQKAGVVAMLSAHLHDYQRWQPINKELGGGTYQIIAGNGGSKGSAPFFGYSTISIMSSGKVQLNSVGFCKGDPYTAAVPQNPTISRDSVVLTWAENPDSFPQPYTGCETEIAERDITTVPE